MGSKWYTQWTTFLIIQILTSPTYTISSFNFTNLEFPKSFIFSTASSAYQIEGAWNVSGKGESIWDRLAHTNPDAILGGVNGDVACNSYYKYKEDIQLIKDIGFKMYRISLSWSRLFPNGYTTNLNDDGVSYYNAVINELLANDIVPMVTLYHWDLPQKLEDEGGWLNANISNIFGDYARACFKLFGDRVKWWLTINEPYLVASGYGNIDYAPMLNQHGTGEYISGHNVLRAHAKAYRIYDKEFRSSQGGNISLPFFGNFYFPKSESSIMDVEAAERANQFTIGWFAHPIFSKKGGYPEVMIENIYNKSIAGGLNESRLPTFTQEEIEELKGSCDYFGLNHYTTKLTEFGINGEDPSINTDMEVVYSINPNIPTAASPTFQVIPKGLRAALVWIKEQYNNPHIFITENGYCDTGEVQDEKRISYHTDYLKEVSGALKEDGCKILGYTVWSILDNLEWRKGYTLKFGLVQVDFNSTERPRKKKLSAQFFKELLQRHSSSKGVSMHYTEFLCLALIFINILCYIY